MSKTAEEIILFIFLSILLTVTAYELKKRFFIPVAPLLLLFGMVERVFGIYIGDLGATVKMLDGLDPAVIQLAIMPALIFEACLAVD